MKMRNLTFLVLICLFLCGPSFVFVAETAGIALPEWLTAEDSRYLSGGASEANVPKNLSVEGFASKELQDSIEVAVGNEVPFKSTALLANAKLQRTAIAASNALFEWECYPTFFGSEYIYDTRQDRLSAMAKSRGEGWFKGINAFGIKLARYAEEHPNVEFVTYLAPGSSTTLFNASEGYVTNAARYDEAARVMSSGHSPLENLHHLRSSYSDPASFLSDYYRFDHHWNYRGAANAYMEICEALNLASDQSSVMMPLDAVASVGSYSRRGLMEKEEAFLGITNKLDGLWGIKSDGEQISVGAHQRYWDSEYNDKRFNAYGLYSEYLEGSSIKGFGDEKNVLLISDSFGGPMQNLFPLSCSNLYQEKTLYDTCKDSSPLEEIMAGKEIDAVVFVGHSGNYSSFITRNPSFFECEDVSL